MKIKKYRGENIKSIFQKVWSELGKEAIIISIEEKKGLGFFGGRAYYEVIASENVSKDVPKPMQKQQEKYKQEYQRIGFEVKEELRELKEWVRYLMSRVSATPVEKRLVGKAESMYRKLVSKGVEKALALSIIEDAMSFGLSEDSIKNVLLGYIRTYKDTLNTRKVMAFVGPTGVGKTTTLAKVAARFEFAKRIRVGILTTDTYRVGSVEQLERYAQIMGVPFGVAPTPESFRNSLSSMWNVDAILVDTVGRSHYDIESIKEIKSVLDGMDEKRRRNFEVHLLLSTSQREDEMVQVIRNFSLLPITHIVFTKLDETLSPGIILNISSYIEKPVSYYTIGQDIPDDIETATIDSTFDIIFKELRSRKIADRILTTA